MTWSAQSSHGRPTDGDFGNHEVAEGKNRLSRLKHGPVSSSVYGLGVTTLAVLRFSGRQRLHQLGSWSRSHTQPPLHRCVYFGKEHLQAGFQIVNVVHANSETVHVKRHVVSRIGG